MTAPRIENYALIGDCQTGALVGTNGSIDWLCWPRFDSGACFAALLGMPRHGRWIISPGASDASVTRAYQGDTNVLETIFETATGTVAVIDFMPIGLPNSSVVRRIEGRRGTVDMRLELILRFDYGSATPWLSEIGGGGVCASVGPNLVVLRGGVPLQIRDNNIYADFSIAEAETVDFALSWGASHAEPPAAFTAGAALRETLAFWEAWSSRCTYQGEWRKLVIRSLLALKAMTYAPTGGIVAALTTSLPELIGGERNWDYRYCWLRDATLTLLALMATGYRDEAQAWGAWLHRAVAGKPEEAQIMYGLSGERTLVEWRAPALPGYEGSAPVRIGNAASEQLQFDVYGEVIGTLHVGRAMGLEEPDFAWALQVLFVEHLISIWEQPDDGIWEVRGGRRQFTHSKVMAWMAVERSIRDAEQFHPDAPPDKWRQTRDRMHEQICDKGFDRARNTFTQSYGRPELDASLLVLPLVGFLPSDDPRILGTIEAIERDLLVDGFVQRYHTGADSGDGLAGGEGAFLPCSFWLVDAYMLAGRRDEARALFGRLAGLVNDVGLLSEEYDTTAKRFVGNFPQAFSHIALIGSALSLDGEALGRSPVGRAERP